jgi:hypothetical protein
LIVIHQEVHATPASVTEHYQPKILKSPSVEPDEVRAVEPAEVRDVEPAEVRAVEPAEVRAVEPTEVRAVEPTEVRAVEPTEVRAVEPPEVRAVEPAKVRAVEPAEGRAVEPVEGRRKKRWGALANTKSPALKFRGNDIDALLLQFFKRFSAVPRTNFPEFFSNFLKKKKLKKKKDDKNTPVSHTLAVIRV